MSASAAALVRSFKVGAYEVTLTFPSLTNEPSVSLVSAEWDPDIPDHMTAEMQAQYKRGSSEAFVEYLALQTASQRKA